MPADDSSDHPTSGDFQRCLEAVLRKAGRNGLSSVVVQSGELHRIVGDYPGKDHRMPTCCRVMIKRMRGGDRRLPDKLKNYGATMRIRYKLD